MTADTPARTPSDTAGQAGPREVERFGPDAERVPDYISRWKAPGGPFVRYEDYAALREKLEAAQAALKDAKENAATFRRMLELAVEDGIVARTKAHFLQEQLTTARAERDAAVVAHSTVCGALATATEQLTAARIAATGAAFLDAIDAAAFTGHAQAGGRE